MHDCRSDCEALLYQHGIRAAALWDTQVWMGGRRATCVWQGTCQMVFVDREHQLR